MYKIKYRDIPTKRYFLPIVGIISLLYLEEVDNYNTIRNEIVKYGKNIYNKYELVALSKFDLVSIEKKELSAIVEKKTGKKPFIFSSILNVGIKDLITALFEQCFNHNDK